MKNKILFAVIIFSIPLFARKQINDSLVNAGIRQIYNLQFKTAETTFAEVIKQNPKSPIGYFFDAMVIWWKISLDMENERYDDIFYDKLETAIDVCDEILDKNPNDVDALFFKGGSLGFRGRLKSIREEWFGAVLDGKDALPLVHKVYAADSTNIDVQLGFGIYNYYAAAVPEKYPFVKPFMAVFPGGNKAKGIRQLEYVANRGKYAKYESQFFLLTLYYGFEEDNLQALKYAERLFNEFPGNSLFERYIGRIHFRLGNKDVSTSVFKSIYEKAVSKKNGYNKNSLREASYYVGLDFIKLQPAKAIEFFEECVKISKELDADEESGFLINATLYLARLYKNDKNYKKASEYYESVLDYRDYRDSHQSAETELDQLEKLIKKK